MRSALAFPFDADTIFRKKKQLKRLLEERRDLVGKRIAVMGGSTTREIIDLLELFLLDQGIKPEFYESAYGAFEHELLFDNDRLKQFKPDVVFIHTNLSNVKFFPSMRDSEEEVRSKLDKEFARFRALWEKVHEAYHCSVVQNNFELPPLRVLGNRDAVDHRGRTGFILGLNQEFAGYARDRRNVFINDIEYLSSWIGLERWCDRPFWHSYKYSLSHEAMPYFCHNLASIIQAMFGKSRKCVVVDLDNTLWGGVIGEDGVNKISLGKDTPLGEAFLEFQGYLKRLKERGILLAVCSKNDLSNALAGLNHPDAVLKPDDFSVIKANWDPKPENIRAIARELNIGEDSLVFIDDDPVEREAVRTFLPAVSVPEVGEDICLFADMIDKNNYFEPLWIGADDVDRSAVYAQEDKRKAAAAASAIRENSCVLYPCRQRSNHSPASTWTVSPSWSIRPTSSI
ncbi:MAG TPA: HAD-IIIC family phosphatase [Candidatus Omnitrophota bacterium]|nr:HAD-IIIC family phosphatase [Candidatus Omnitrophota bacterium]